MVNPRTHLLSLAKPRTRNMRPRSSTNATKHGDASSLARPPTIRLAAISPCELFKFVHFFKNRSLVVSSNITISNSPSGFLRRHEPAYTKLPPDSRKPPAPIDPSGKENTVQSKFLLRPTHKQYQNGSTFHPHKYNPRKLHLYRSLCHLDSYKYKPLALRSVTIYMIMLGRIS